MALFENVPYTNFQDMNLDYLIKVAKEVKRVAETMEEWMRDHEEEYLDLKARVDELDQWVYNMNIGNIPDGVIEGLRTWLDANMVELLRRAIKFVWFGLTDDGYFVAYVPDSWADISFDTIMDYNDVNYGHLVLITNVDEVI